jgi:hypothetical protein
MANIGTLSVSILAKTSKFKKGMKGVTRQLNMLKRNIFSMGGALTALATGGGLGIFLKNLSVTIDQSAKFADVIGLTTKQLAGYQLAAKITGVELNQLNTGFTRFQKNIGDAEDGLSTAVRSLGKLNLVWTDLKNLSTDEQLRLVADRFIGLNNQIDKSNVLLNLFGRSGLPLGKLLNEGSKGIERFINEADKLGTAFTRVDAAKVEMANDAMARVQELVKGIGQDIVIDFAPKVLAVAEMLLETGTAGEGMGSKVAGALDSMEEKASIAIRVFRTLQLGIEMVKMNVFALAAAITGLASLPSKLLGGDGGFLGALASDFEQAGRDSFNKVLELSDDVSNDTTGGAFLDFLDKADTKAQKIAETLNTSSEEFSEPITKASKTVQFQEIDLKRVVIGGLAAGAKKEQMVKDPQLIITNKLLEKISRSSTGGGTTLAVAG